MAQTEKHPQAWLVPLKLAGHGQTGEQKSWVKVHSRVKNPKAPRPRTMETAKPCSGPGTVFTMDQCANIPTTASSSQMTATGDCSPTQTSFAGEFHA